MSIFSNYPLIAAFVAINLAQLLKFPLNILINHKVEPIIIFSNGGMPSSHSAFVTALATALGVEYGISSPYFAIAFVFAAITMWDAAGIRYQASKHAQILNILIRDFRLLVEQVKYKPSASDEISESPLKELLGHKPTEVMIGSLFGIIVALLMQFFY